MRIMKSAMYPDSIHNVGSDPFYVHYWTNHQIHVYKSYAAMKSSCVCMDASGGSFEKVRNGSGALSKHIFLYICVVNCDGTQYTVSQMLSESQHTTTIQYWLLEWGRSGCPHPKEVVTDSSRALLTAVIRTFTGYFTIEDYADACNETSVPKCYVRIDVAHFIKGYASFVKDLRRSVKIFYLASIGLLIRSTSSSESRSILSDILRVAFSEQDGNLPDGRPCQTEISRKRLTSLITGSPAEHDAESSLEDAAVHQPETGTEEIVRESSWSEWAAAVKTEITQSQDPIGEHESAHYFPGLADRLMRDMRHFPLWSCVCRDQFGYGRIPASSAPVEGEFNKIKNTLLGGKTGIRPDTFVKTHLDYLSGKMKLVDAALTEMASDESDESIVGKEIPTDADTEERGTKTVRKTTFAATERVCSQNEDMNGETTVPSTTSASTRGLCPACSRGDMPSGAHKCVSCGRIVHALEHCSYPAADAEEGFGQGRICEACYERRPQEDSELESASCPELPQSKSRRPSRNILNRWQDTGISRDEKQSRSGESLSVTSNHGIQDKNSYTKSADRKVASGTCVPEASTATKQRGTKIIRKTTSVATRGSSFETENSGPSTEQRDVVTSGTLVPKTTTATKKRAYDDIRKKISRAPLWCSSESEDTDSGPDTELQKVVPERDGVHEIDKRPQTESRQIARKMHNGRQATRFSEDDERPSSGKSRSDNRVQALQYTDSDSSTEQREIFSSGIRAEEKSADDRFPALQRRCITCDQFEDSIGNGTDPTREKREEIYMCEDCLIRPAEPTTAEASPIASDNVRHHSPSESIGLSQNVQRENQVWSSGGENKTSDKPVVKEASSITAVSKIHATARATSLDEKCSACAHDNAASSKFQCVCCDQQVHALEQCSQPIDKAGIGQARICNPCYSSESLVPPEIIAAREIEHWRGLAKPSGSQQKKYRESKRRGIYLGQNTQKVKDGLTFEKHADIPIMRNGTSTKLQAVRIGKEKISLTNTCAFDTCFQLLLAAAVDYPVLREAMDEFREENDLYSLIIDTLATGLGQQSYRRRVEILREIPSEKDEDDKGSSITKDKFGNVRMNCEVNIGYLASRLFKKTPSFREQFECNNGCPSKVYDLAAASVSNDMLLSAGFCKIIGDGVLLGGCKNCSSKGCDGITQRTQASIGNIILFDVFSGSDQPFSMRLGDIPTQIENPLPGGEYSEAAEKSNSTDSRLTLIGVAKFVGAALRTRHTDKQCGHYTAIVLRQGQQWVEYNDQRTTSKTISKNLYVTPGMIVYARV